MQVTVIELERFFQELGQFTYYAQHAEHICRQILMIYEVKSRGRWPVGPEEGAEIGRIFEEKTLGALIGRLEKVPEFPQPLLEKMRDLNGERKQIIHHLARSIGDFSSNPALRRMVISKLIAAHDLASAVSEQLVGYAVGLAAQDGYHLEQGSMRASSPL
jgi:hypothetical protein